MQENKMPTVLIIVASCLKEKIDGCGVCGLRVGKRIDKSRNAHQPVPADALSSVLSRAAAASNAGAACVHELYECWEQQETRSCNAARDCSLLFVPRNTPNLGSLCPRFFLPTVPEHVFIRRKRVHDLEILQKLY